MRESGCDFFLAYTQKVGGAVPPLQKVGVTPTFSRQFSSYYSCNIYVQIQTYLHVICELNDDSDDVLTEHRPCSTVKNEIP